MNNKKSEDEIEKEEKGQDLSIQNKVSKSFSEISGSLQFFWPHETLYWKIIIESILKAKISLIDRDGRDEEFVLDENNLTKKNYA